MKMKTENGQTKQPLSIIFNFQVIEKSLYFFNNWYGIMSLQIKFIRICAVFFWLFFWGFFLLWISLTVWFWLLLLLEMVSFYSFLSNVLGLGICISKCCQIGSGSKCLCSLVSHSCFKYWAEYIFVSIICACSFYGTFKICL